MPALLSAPLKLPPPCCPPPVGLPAGHRTAGYFRLGPVQVPAHTSTSEPNLRPALTTGAVPLPARRRRACCGAGQPPRRGYRERTRRCQRCRSCASRSCRRWAAVRASGQRAVGPCRGGTRQRRSRQGVASRRRTRRRPGRTRGRRRSSAHPPQRSSRTSSARQRRQMWRVARYARGQPKQTHPCSRQGATSGPDGTRSSARPRAGKICPGGASGCPRARGGGREAPTGAGEGAPRVGTNF